MNDLISRKNVLDEIFVLGFGYAHHDVIRLFCKRLNESIESIPAVDAVEVEHGRWEKASEMMPIYRCSVCKERNLFKNGDNVFSNYCPNCGAKMDGERKEND